MSTLRTRRTFSISTKSCKHSVVCEPEAVPKNYTEILKTRVAILRFRRFHDCSPPDSLMFNQLARDAKFRRHRLRGNSVAEAEDRAMPHGASISRPILVSRNLDQPQRYSRNREAVSSPPRQDSRPRGQDPSVNGALHFNDSTTNREPFQR